MTCIVAIKHDSEIYIAGDSAGVSGISVRIRTDPKVFFKNGMVFGFTSSFRMGQVLHHDFEPPQMNDSHKSVYGFMITEFVETLRDCFKEKGYGKFTESEENEGGEFIVGYKGELFHIYSDFQVGINSDSYTSAGCGEEYSLGSLYSTDKFDLEPKLKLLEALDSAEYFSGGVCKPYNFVGVDKKGEEIVITEKELRKLKVTLLSQKSKQRAKQRVGKKK